MSSGFGRLPEDFSKKGKVGRGSDEIKRVEARREKLGDPVLWGRDAIMIRRMIAEARGGSKGSVRSAMLSGQSSRCSS